MAVLVVAAACTVATDSQRSGEDATAPSLATTSSTTTTLAPAPPLAGDLRPRIESSELGTLAAVTFDDARELRGICWNVSVWDGAGFVVTYVTGMAISAEEALEIGVTRLTEFGDAVYSCPAIGWRGIGPDFLFLPSTIGSGTFRVCQGRRCFQFATDLADSRSPSVSSSEPTVLTSTPGSTVAAAPALVGGLHPLVESTADGTLVAMWSKAGTERGPCWTISRWDGAQFAETFVATATQIVNEAKDSEVSRLDDQRSTFLCPDRVFRHVGPDFLFMPSDVIGSGTFRVCEDEKCFQFTS